MACYCCGSSQSPPATLLKLARHFPNNGEPARHKSHFLSSHPDIELLGNVAAADGTPAYLNKIGIEWHTDGTGKESPTSATFLYAVEAPSRGGDTLFASGYRAWEVQPDELKPQLERLRVRYNERVLREKEAALNDVSVAELDKTWGSAEVFERPLVRIHPISGKRSLWVTWAEMECIVGPTPEESLAFVMSLLERAIAPENVYAHRWEPEDLVIWDNRCMLHSTTPYTYGNERRLMYRVGLNCDEAITHALGE